MYGPAPYLRESAAGRAASADASALSPRSPAGADSSGQSLQVSRQGIKKKSMIDLVMGGKLLKEAAKYQHGPLSSLSVNAG